jgi:hypothetical protein
MKPAKLKQIRNLLWLYFWLLILEGALRKWLLPGLANPLLLVREPVALLAVIWAWPLLRKRRWQQWLKPLFIIGPLAFVFAITVGHGDIFTALYGMRVIVLQLPLIFVYAAVFQRDDVIKTAWIMVLLSIPMTLLLVLQSNQSDSHFLNVGAGGLGSASFTGALGRSRPSGTFSFITGVVSFYSLAASSLFILLYNVPIRLMGRIICIVAGIALVVALPVSISRSLLAGYIMVAVALIAALTISRTKLLSLLVGLVALSLAIGLATMIPAFQDTSEAFVARWDDAGSASGQDRTEVGDLGVAAGQIEGRVLPGFIHPFEKLARTPMLGYGIGMGSNVAAQRLGLRAFALGEGGWDVNIGELGQLLGLSFVIWRISLSIWILRLSLQAASRGNQLPLILLGASFLQLMHGQFSQPTALGFVAFSAGLTLAACNTHSLNPVVVNTGNTRLHGSSLVQTA